MILTGHSITGLAAASQLANSYDVTIVARNLPGDPDSHEWASPWAGAVFLPLDGSTPQEQKMQADSFSFLWNLARSEPDSSVRVSTDHCD